jgi:putative tryptophan/tyrosine transport system substrate-binding protein
LLAIQRLLVLLLMGFLPMAAAQATVWIAVSEGSPDYGEVAETMRAQLQRGEGAADVTIRPWGEMAQGVPPQVKQIVTVGSPAFIGMADAAVSGRIGRVPIVATLLPRAVFEAQRRRISGSVTGVVLDQPAIRQMALLRYAFPHLRRVGVLLGPDSQQYQAALEKAATEMNLQLNAYKVEGDASLYPTLQRVLDENDVLLAIPDAAVYNGGSVQNVLLASYRQKVPLMGFSPAYVRAGAMLALYSSPVQVASQTVRVVRSALAGVALQTVQIPTEFVIGVNAQVARSLGFRLSEDALRIQLQSREGL